MRLSVGTAAVTAEEVAEHVALAPGRPTGRALVRLNMIGSADGGSAVAGRSGRLGRGGDHAVFAALREQADAVLVGMSTAVSEGYHAPSSPDLQMLVVASSPDISANAELFAGGATLVLAEDAGAAPAGVATLRAGTGGRVDLAAVAARLEGKVVMMEGGPRLAGTMVALGLVDEFFLSVAPLLVAGDSSRVVHGPDAGADPWTLAHGLVDDEGYLFLRYARSTVG